MNRPRIFFSLLQAVHIDSIRPNHRGKLAVSRSSSCLSSPDVRSSDVEASRAAFASFGLANPPFHSPSRLRGRAGASSLLAFVSMTSLRRSPDAPCCGAGAGGEGEGDCCCDLPPSAAPAAPFGPFFFFFFAAAPPPPSASPSPPPRWPALRPRCPASPPAPPAAPSSAKTHPHARNHSSAGGTSCGRHRRQTAPGPATEPQEMSCCGGDLALHMRSLSGAEARCCSAASALAAQLSAAQRSGRWRSEARPPVTSLPKHMRPTGRRKAECNREGDGDSFSGGARTSKPSCPASHRASTLGAYAFTAAASAARRRSTDRASIRYGACGRTHADTHAHTRAH